MLCWTEVAEIIWVIWPKYHATVDFTFWDSPFPLTICWWRLSGRHGSYAPRTESEDLGRRWPDCSSHADKYRSRIESNASWKETLWRSHWAQNPQSEGPGQRIVRRWWSDAGVCGAVACWIGSDGHLLQKRSWSRNKRCNPCRGPPSSQHPRLCDRNSSWSLPRVQSDGQGGNPWVSDGYWGTCLSKLRVFGKHHYPWVGDGHWGWCLSSLQFFEKHRYPWVCDGHWEVCLSRLHFFGEHHNPSVSDSHWDVCLCRLQFFGKHHCPWVCDGCWGQSLCRLQVFGKHHYPWVCDNYWEWSLCRLQVFGKHHSPWVRDGSWECSLCRLQVFGKHHSPGDRDVHWGQCLSKLHVFGEHHYPRFCVSHRGPCLSRLQFFDKNHYPGVCDVHWKLCLWWEVTRRTTPCLTVLEVLKKRHVFFDIFWRFDLGTPFGRFRAVH